MNTEIICRKYYSREQAESRESVVPGRTATERGAIGLRSYDSRWQKDGPAKGLGHEIEPLEESIASTWSPSARGGQPGKALPPVGGARQGPGGLR